MKKKLIERVDIAFQRWAEWKLSPIPQLGFPTEVFAHPAVANRFQEQAAESSRLVLRQSKSADWCKTSSTRPKQRGHGCLYMPNPYMAEVDKVYGDLPYKWKIIIDYKYLSPLKDNQIAEELGIARSTFSEKLHRIYHFTAKQLDIK